MCGNVGVAGKLEFKDEALMKRLLVFDFFRGPDSTGFAALRTNGDVKIAKTAGSPVDLFDTGKFKEALSGHNSTIFLGHNRLATKGRISSFNAHPYQFGDIVGCHNGTLDQASWDWLNKKMDEKFDVDSMALIAAIAKFGPNEIIPNIRGAWALVWFDAKTQELNFLRNKERPFWLAYSKDFKKVFWASEHPILNAATALATNENQTYDLFQTEDENQYRFFETEENWWYKLDINELTKGSTERPKPRVQVVKGLDPLPVTTTHSNVGTSNYGYQCYNGGGKGTDPFNRNGATSTQQGTSSATTPDKSSKSTSTSTTTSTNSDGTSVGKTGSNVIPFEPNIVKHFQGTVNNPLANTISKEKFEEFAKFGCAFCSKDVDYEEIGVVVLEQYDAVMCPQCGDAGADGSSRVYVSPGVHVA